MKQDIIELLWKWAPPVAAAPVQHDPLLQRRAAAPLP